MTPSVYVHVYVLLRAHMNISQCVYVFTCLYRCQFHTHRSMLRDTKTMTLYPGETTSIYDRTVRT